MRASGGPYALLSVSMYPDSRFGVGFLLSIATLERGTREYTKEFIELFETATKIARSPIRILTPFLNMRKADVIRLGYKLGVPFELTWSCVRPINGKHCGRCPGCLRRKKALKEASVPDPTVYVYVD